MTDLTGKGKPFHSALDKAAALLKRKVGTGQEFMKELQGLGGIKQAEIDERKLGALMGLPKMTHEQFLAELGNRPIPAIGEKVLGSEPDKKMVEAIAREIAQEQAYEELRDEGMGVNLARDVARDLAAERYTEYMDEARRSLGDNGATYHEKWTIPGGENYREMLIKAPKGDDDFGGVGGHFGGEGNILASMRLKDRMVPDLEGPHSVKVIGGGGTTTVKHPTREAAERFADVKHQGGFRTEIKPLNQKKLLHLEELQSDWHQQGREKGYGKQKLEPLSKEEDDELMRLYNMGRDARTSAQTALMQQLNDRLNASHGKPVGVPDAPFKKNWEEMALKRLIHHAAEKGYHGVVVTPGKEQADRYSLAKHIDDLHYSGSNLVAYDPEGNEVIKRTGVRPQDLPEIVGKELADKLMAQEPRGTLRSLSGVDLEVGGEGMKGFYDKKVPNILNAIGKKHGVKTQLHGHTIMGRGRERTEEEFRQATQNVPFERHKEFDYEPKPIPVHHFPITEEMRKDILTNGLPLYAEGGIIHKAEGGQVQPSIAQMRMALMQNKFPSQAALDKIGAEEAPNMPVKAYVPPAGGQDGQLPVGGIDMSDITPGMQYMPEEQQAMQPPGQPAPQGPSPLSAGTSSPSQQSNILQMTPQGQAMAAMQPNAVKPQMASGGPVPVQNHPFQTAGQKPIPFMAKVGGSDNMPMDNQSMDNGATTFDIDNIQELAKGGSSKPAKSLHYEPAPSLSKKEIEAMADRMARQMAGMDNPNQKTLQQLAREQNLPIGIKSSKKMDVPIINYEDLKDSYSVGVPGDTSRGGVKPTKAGRIGSPKAGEYLTHIGGEALDKPVGLFGGKDYGAYGHPAGWASDLGASAGMFNLVKKLSEENPERQVYGHYHKMSPEALNHAVHMLDAVISHHKPHASPADQISMLNDLMRNKTTTTSKHDVPYPEFPGFENPADIMLHGQMNSGMRKKIIGLLGKEKYFPGGKQKLDDIIYAISHPELRNIETGAGGSSIIKFDPSRNLKESISPHPTYGHDIPSKLVGRTRYTTPAELLAPRSMANAKREIAAMGKKVVPFNQAKMNIIREPIDEQYINQLGEYELAMKKRLGYKKGGKASSSKLSDNLDTMRLALTKKKAK